MSDSLLIGCPSCQKLNRIPAQRLADGARCGSCKSPIFTTHPVDVSHATFATHVLRTELPVVVDFWAPWCGPCKMMAPVFHSAANQLEPNVRFVKINTEVEQQLAAQYGIRSIPTLAMFHKGKEINRMAGALDQSSLLRWIAQNMPT